ncbi:restriction endonuclease subunit S [Glutamicibacter arilaitensis]|uniref:restriction endonuclease subunit S n=1 Tax=Glutamicibacter arilaitensis TaxID=256701 RepID=UPI003FD64508
MSRIDELIAEHCPGGVEHQPLGAVGEFIRGNGLQKKDLFDEGFPAVHYGQIHTKYGVWTEETFSFTLPTIAAKLRHASYGDLLIATTSEDDEAVAKATAWLGNTDVVLSGDAYIYRHSLDPRYVAYFFQSEPFQEQKKRYISGTKVRRISGSSLAKILIPVPPLEVQREIVRILDTFSKMEAELEAELEARKQQYEFYADQLLTVERDIQRVKFGDVATIVRGASPRPIQAFLTNQADGVPWIKIGDVPAGGKYITTTAQCVTPAGAAKSRRVKPGDFVLSNSMSFGRPYVSKIDGYIHDGWLAISNFEQYYVRDYLYYLLRSKAIQEDFARKAGAGTVKNLNADIVRSVVIPLPPKEDQERVVDLLDRFDALVNDISTGLPAELAARRQQYEYYRDKLLTFKPLETAS